MQLGKPVLFTVLDWGLGHATRSIPIIHAFLRKGFQVSIAGEGNSLLILKKEFPELSFYPLEGIQVRYTNSSLAVFAPLQIRAPLMSIPIKFLSGLS